MFERLLFLVFFLLENDHANRFNKIVIFVQVVTPTASGPSASPGKNRFPSIKLKPQSLAVSSTTSQVRRSMVANWNQVSKFIYLSFRVNEKACPRIKRLVVGRCNCVSGADVSIVSNLLESA